ncbi:MAG: HD domain-containing protein [Sphaerochaeta sp.]|jgi:uncharacterized protein|uniref:HD domain-containing protein n=1 Tax=Sphaerochaeta sp. TaxID=1972642 RepID=UPI002FC93E2A
MDTMLITKISELVERACASENNTHGYEIWKFHIHPMVSIAQDLAVAHGADCEIVTLAVLLHDLAGIEDYSKQELHHWYGAQRAREILASNQYPERKTELVAQCILHHRGSVPMIKETAEERCVADADAIAHMSDLSSLFFVAYGKKRMAREDGKIWVMQKIQRDWNKMSEIAQEQYGTLYKEIRRLLS